MNEIVSKFPNKKGLLKVYFHVAENSGVGLYRQYQLAHELQKQGKANVLINDFTWGEARYALNDAKGKQVLFDTKVAALSAIAEGKFSLQEVQEVGMINPEMDVLIDICNWADIVVVGRQDMGQYLATWGGIRQFFNMPIVMDTDDNVRHVRPSNPGYSSYHPNSEHIEWNKHAFRKVFDAITVSTDDLKKYHERENPKILVVPNSIDFDVWKFAQKKDDDTIRISFNGSSSHWEGVRIIEKAVVRILKEYPNVKFLIPGVYKEIFKEYPEIQSQIDFYPWIPLKRFAEGLKGQNIDIGLAPLTDNDFNRCKSNLRWLEYSALKIPVICSPVRAYKNVVHNKTGLLALEKDEWYTAIKALIESKELRTTLAENAYTEVREKYNLEINAPKVLPFLKDVVDKYHSLLGKKKRYTKVKDGWQELK